jgi:unsaturated rhamnogalacturonyl hydrolase
MDEKAISEDTADVEGRLRRAADLLMRYRFQVWRYGDSVGFEGLLAATDVLHNPRYEAWAYGAIRGWAPRMEPFDPFDNTVPGHAICSLFERTGDDALIEAAVRIAAFLRSRPCIADVFVSQPEIPLRPPYGTTKLGAPEAALLPAPGPGVLVDCLHFDPPFFAHLGSLIERDEMLDEAARQALGYISLLQDEDGLFWHFFLERTGRRYGYGWGRGQGWALLGLLDVLDYLPVSHPGRAPIAAALRALCGALVETQLPTGGWASIANEPTSMPEASTAAFVAAGFARALSTGLLDQSYQHAALAAWKDTLTHLQDNGLLGSVSAAVYPSTVNDHYGLTPTGFLVPWGQGPLLLAAKHISDSEWFLKTATGTTSRSSGQS